MSTREELWKFIEPTVRSEGLEVYDIDLPSAAQRVLRIFLARASEGDRVSQNLQTGKEGDASEGRHAGVGLEECARVSKNLGRLEGFEDMLASNTTLEVSSPGINRRLRLPQHFVGAEGEHIFLKVYDVKTQANRSMRGRLLRFQDDGLEVQEDGQTEARRFALEDVVDARIDFLFQ